jgi:hypothetical protein
MKRIAAMLAVVVASTLVGGSPAHADVSPIRPDNRPTPLPGQTNGLVSRSQLINVAPNCLAARVAGPSLARLFALARMSNIGLGAEECYRTLADQVKYANQANQPGNNPACVASVSRAPSGAPIGNSYHGWGKAADLTDGRNSLTFSSPGYWFLKQNAGSVGWNHPGFAEPGGSTCPEPWHWEWVGDGGQLGLSPRRGDVVALLPSADDHGYAVVTGLGGLERHGDFVDRGNASRIGLQWVMIGAASKPQRDGYWMVGADGGVFTFGNAGFYGSTGGRRLSQPVIGMAATPTGKGYWLVAWDGGVFSFGDAKFFGSTGALRLKSPVVGMAATPTGKGYWLVAADGGVFTFGDAKFFGSMGARYLRSPVVGMAPRPNGDGYWLVAADGGVFTFGRSQFFGSLGGGSVGVPIVAIVPTKTAKGYWIQVADGTVAAFGDAKNY